MIQISCQGERGMLVTLLTCVSGITEAFIHAILNLIKFIAVGSIVNSFIDLILTGSIIAISFAAFNDLRKKSNPDKTNYYLGFLAAIIFSAFAVSYMILTAVLFTSATNMTNSWLNIAPIGLLFTLFSCISVYLVARFSRIRNADHGSTLAFCLGFSCFQPLLIGGIFFVFVLSNLGMQIFLYGLRFAASLAKPDKALPPITEFTYIDTFSATVSIGLLAHIAVYFVFAFWLVQFIRLKKWKLLGQAAALVFFVQIISNSGEGADGTYLLPEIVIQLTLLALGLATLHLIKKQIWN